MNSSSFWKMAACVVFLFAGCSENSMSNNHVEDRGAETPTNLPDATNPGDTKRDSTEADSFFVVDHYDPQRDAAKDLEMTTKLAGNSGKRILVEVGGKW